ncbi:MAG: MAPEG family protein [Sterolibacterium sp.]|nr:MAPEG family protein [Sterolibacterium sp.]
MTLALWCVLIATLLPYVWSTLSKTDPNYDNASPRLLARVGWRQRADWAQQNSWEAFAPFAAAVLIAQGCHAEQASIDLLACMFIGFRVAYGLCYLMNRALLRSLAWTAGFACIIGLYVLAARAGAGA